jgi:hypothetical protein
MRFRTFLTTGVEVLHLGGQHYESNAWPIEYWRANSGRWRLFTPAIDDFLNESLAGESFGASIKAFVLLLEVADFESWGIGVAFTGPEGYTRYKPKTKELWSVGRIDWLKVEKLPARQQLNAYGNALQFAIAKVTTAKRRPREFDANAFAAFVANRLRSAKVSHLSSSAYAARREA